MAKIQTKSDNINPFGGLFPIFKTFDKSGVRNVIDRTLGPRGTLLAFSHGIRIASSDTIERALRKLSEENTSHSSVNRGHEREQGTGSVHPSVRMKETERRTILQEQIQSILRKSLNQKDG